MSKSKWYEIKLFITSANREYAAHFPVFTGAVRPYSLAFRPFGAYYNASEHRILSAVSQNFARLLMKKIYIIITIVIVALLMWSPWITSDYAKKKVMASADFIATHPEGLPETEVHVIWLPFVRMVTTYEKGWFVSFLGF